MGKVKTKEDKRGGVISLHSNVGRRPLRTASWTHQHVLLHNSRNSENDSRISMFSNPWIEVPGDTRERLLNKRDKM
jgi:hypothetical protein